MTGEFTNRATLDDSASAGSEQASAQRSSSPPAVGARPLFRWVGGKQRLLPKIIPFLPSEFGTYYEPFFGGGALYFRLSPREAVLGDKNPEVTNYLQVVKESPGALVRALSRLRNSEAAYYKVRGSVPVSPIQRAARFQYLVNLGFSGVYRVNKKGNFNVPYSGESDRVFFDGNQIWRAHRCLKSATIITGEFDETVTTAVAGDLVYFDPPYTVAHDNNGFLEYNEHIFQWQDQMKLARLVKELAARGVKVVVSNANHASVRALYDEAKIYEICRRSTIAAGSKFRGEVKEVLIVYV